MPRREDDAVARGAGSAQSPSLLFLGGFALAVVATLAVFLTDKPQYLRIAVVAVAWAFVLAAFAAGRRGTDRVAAAAREKELRRIYERELDREVAARREYELELENELRRETEDAMRYELDALRGELAALASLRDEVARVSELRGDIAALGALRDEVARVSALRDDVASLGSLREDVASLTPLRQELGQLADLRADMGRLRAELTEQLSSEMLVERIVMRTQASRLPLEQARPDAGRTLDPRATWTDDAPPQELTGGWPAIRLDEPHAFPRETQQFQQVRAEPWPGDPSTPSPITARPPVPPAPQHRPDPAPAQSPLSDFDLFGPAAAAAPTTPPAAPPASLAPTQDEPRSRHAAREAEGPPQTTVSPVALPPLAPTPAPWELLSAGELLDAPAVPEAAPRPSPRPRPSPGPSTRSLPEVPPRRRRTADPAPGPATAAHPLAPAPSTPPSGSGGDAGSPDTGRRRRRRYREDDEPDDVLARVLRGQ